MSLIQTVLNISTKLLAERRLVSLVTLGEYYSLGITSQNLLVLHKLPTTCFSQVLFNVANESDINCVVFIKLSNLLVMPYFPTINLSEVGVVDGVFSFLVTC